MKNTFFSLNLNLVTTIMEIINFNQENLNKNNKLYISLRSKHFCTINNRSIFKMKKLHI